MNSGAKSDGCSCFFAVVLIVLANVAVFWAVRLVTDWTSKVDARLDALEAAQTEKK